MYTCDYNKRYYYYISHNPTKASIMMIFQCSTMALVPPLAVMLAKSSAVDSYDLSHVSTIVSASAPLSAEVEQLLKRKLGSHIEICQGKIFTRITLLML